MSIRALATALAAAASFLFVSSVAGFAQTRSWVSGTGNDVNPCSRTAPCKTFAGALLKTSDGGEINVLDAGGFGGFTITKSISIIAEGATAGVLVSGTNGIAINSATAVVTLRGLDIEGLGSSLSGIRIISAAAVHIEKVQIRGFSSNQPANYAIDVENSAGMVKVHVSDSTITNNLRGVGVNPTGMGTATVVLDNVTIEKNSTGVRAGNGATVWLNNSVITNNTAGVSAVGTAVANSLKNNFISGNTNDVPDNALTPVNPK
jgi:hypothetical protein